MSGQNRIMIIVLLAAVLIAAVIIGSSLQTSQQRNDTELTLTGLRLFNDSLATEREVTRTHQR